MPRLILLAPPEVDIWRQFGTRVSNQGGDAISKMDLRIFLLRSERTYDNWSVLRVERMEYPKITTEERAENG